MATVLFVCLHNAGRSQMSQALFERAAEGRHRALSAGTTPAGRVHAEVIEVMRELGVDLADRKPQLLIRELALSADIIVTMGCGDQCPYIPGKRYIDWDLPDPAGRPLDEVRNTRDEICARVQTLIDELATEGPAYQPSVTRDLTRIRRATADDLRDVVSIYNSGIAERIATFETIPRSVDDLASWLDDGQPFVVAEHDRRVVGWARAGPYSDRCVYRGVGEHAVYVSTGARGRGLGRRLLIELCAQAEAQGLYKLTSRIFTDNPASLAAHRAAGFEEVGIQRRHGKLDGQWKDCVLVERLLGSAAV